MAVFHVNPSDPAKRYFSTSSGLASVEDRKAKFGPIWAELAPEAQDIMIAKWEAIEGDEEKVSGLETIKEITAFLKAESARTNPSEAARKQLVQEVLSVSLKEALQVKYTGKRASAQVDLIDAVKNAVGISYKNLAGWLYTEEKQDNKVIKHEIAAAGDVRAEIQKRADAENVASEDEASFQFA